MLFVEGNHYCMFCEKSGNCELQAMAYRFGYTFVNVASVVGVGEAALGKVSLGAADDVARLRMLHPRLNPAEAGMLNLTSANSGADAIGVMSRRLDRLGYDSANADRIIQSIQSGEQVVVVGENMRRVNAVANMVNDAGGRAVTYAPRNWTGVNRNTLEANRSWIRYWAKDKGSPVIDIGRQPTPRATGPSPFYAIENRSLNRWGIYTPFDQ